jgi:hypothetical protein
MTTSFPEDLIRKRAERSDASGEVMIGFAALLVIDAMVAQNLCDLRLAKQSLPPFDRVGLGRA